MALKGKPARFYRPRPGNRDEVIFDADEIDSMAPSSPTQVVTAPRVDSLATPRAGGHTPAMARLGRLLQRLSAPPLLLPPPAPPRDWLTPAEAAAQEGLSEQFIRRAIRVGVLRVVRDGGDYKVYQASLATLATLAQTTVELRAALKGRGRAANG